MTSEKTNAKKHPFSVTAASIALPAAIVLTAANSAVMAQPSRSSSVQTSAQQAGERVVQSGRIFNQAEVVAEFLRRSEACLFAEED